MPETFENPVAKMRGQVLSIGSLITTDIGATYELGEIGRSGRRLGAVLIVDPKSRHARWVQVAFTPGLTIEEEEL